MNFLGTFFFLSTPENTLKPRTSSSLNNFPFRLTMPFLNYYCAITPVVFFFFFLKFSGEDKLESKAHFSRKNSMILSQEKFQREGVPNFFLKVSFNTSLLHLWGTSISSFRICPFLVDSKCNKYISL